MGNLQGKGGGSTPSLNVPPNNILDAIARASREAERLRAQQVGQGASDSDDYDSNSDSEERVEGNKKSVGKVSGRGKANDGPADATRPWLISSKDDLDMERAEIKALKDKCASNYPGMQSSYIDKIKWAEANSRLLQSKGDVGYILREVIYDKAPDEILIQVLIRKRSLNSIVTTNEGMARAFLDMFPQKTSVCKMDSSDSKKDELVQAEIEKTINDRPGIPDFFLRPDAPDSVHDSSLKANERMTKYIQWITDEEDSGTILSPKPTNKSASTEAKSNGASQPKQSQRKNNTRSALTCLFNIKAKKNTIISRGIVDPMDSIVKLLPGYRLINVGPSPLPPQFITTLLKIEQDTKVGSLPHFPSPNYYPDKSNDTEKEVTCAAIEIMIAQPANSSMKPSTPTNSSVESSSPTTVDGKSVESTETESKVEKTKFSMSDTIHHNDRLYAELIQMKKKHKEKTFYIVNLKDFNTNISFLLPSRSHQKRSLSDDSSFPVIWMSSYFDVCFPRLYSHYNRGKGESINTRNKILSRSSPDDKNDYYDCKFELLESNLSAIIENGCHLSQADQFCSILALTLVIALDASNWSAQTLEKNDVCDDFGELFEDLGTFWKSIMKNRDEDIGLGLSYDPISSEISGSRKALLQLLSFLEQNIQSTYGHLLEDNQTVDFGGSDDVEEISFSAATGTEKKRSRTSSE